TYLNRQNTMVLLVRPSDLHGILGTLVPRGGHFSGKGAGGDAPYGTPAVLNEVRKLGESR
ncbi:hypothetical protein J4212_06110, partial [Candidatus Woesearchaeota archaeon]|nr:hypothetical protein [Candidatus Woesearchaeota archaeon]